MTSKKHYSILFALLLIPALFLVACVRPLPGDNDAFATVAPVDTDSSSIPETYPGPSVVGEEDTAAGYPAGEGSATGEEGEVVDADLLQPADESEADTEGYPGTESEVADSVDADSVDADTVDADSTDAGSDDADSDDADSDDADSDDADSDDADAPEESQPIERGRTHTVALGENLYRISMQYGISWVTLAQANGISNPDSLFVGQILNIPDVDAADTTETSESTEASDTDESTEDVEDPEAAEDEQSDTDEAESEATTYIVQSGDNLYRISLQVGVSMMEIARSNGLVDFNQVYVGQKLIIPREDVVESPAEEVKHIVADGETVFGIAFQYGIAWTKLVEANEIPSPYTLEVGQILIIPSGE